MLENGQDPFVRGMTRLPGALYGLIVLGWLGLL